MAFPPMRRQPTWHWSPCHDDGRSLNAVADPMWSTLWSPPWRYRNCPPGICKRCYHRHVRFDGATLTLKKTRNTCWPELSLRPSDPIEAAIARP